MPNLSLLPCTPDRATLPFLPQAALARGRVHEICGPARRSLALWIAGQTQGPVIWIHAAWQTERLNPDGLHRFIDPARLLCISPDRPQDILWTMEEVLRCGCAPLVVADLGAPPALTPVRRLHLAAGTPEPAAAPLGLLLCPGDGGAPGVENRWHFAPVHAPGRQLWRLDRRRARTEPPRVWDIAQTRPRGAPVVVPGSAPAPGSAP